MGFVLDSVTNPSVMLFSCTLTAVMDANCTPTGMYMLTTYATQT